MVKSIILVSHFIFQLDILKSIIRLNRKESTQNRVNCEKRLAASLPVCKNSPEIPRVSCDIMGHPYISQILELVDACEIYLNTKSYLVYNNSINTEMKI